MMAHTEELVGTIRGTAELPDTATPSLSGVQTIDLSAPEPVPTTHLALTAHNSKRLALPKSVPSRFLTPGGYLQFTLTLSYQHGVALILELCSADPEQLSSIILDIEVNDHPMGFALPGKSNFYTRSWYLLADWLRRGKNQITIKLPDEAETSVLFKSVSIMRFNLKKQDQTNWCWAAVTTAIHRFFDAECTLQQSDIVQACLNHTHNKTWDLDLALKKRGLLACAHEAVPALGEIRKQLSAGLPVPVRIAWTDKRRKLSATGHFVVITGVLQEAEDDDDTLVRVSDPQLGTVSYIHYKVLKNSYPPKKGRLTHFYLLKRQEGTLKQARKETSV